MCIVQSKVRAWQISGEQGVKVQQKRLRRPFDLGETLGQQHSQLDTLSQCLDPYHPTSLIGWVQALRLLAHTVSHSIGLLGVFAIFISPVQDPSEHPSSTGAVGLYGVDMEQGQGACLPVWELPPAVRLSCPSVRRDHTLGCPLRALAHSRVSNIKLYILFSWDSPDPFCLYGVVLKLHVNIHVHKHLSSYRCCTHTHKTEENRLSNRQSSCNIFKLLPKKKNLVYKLHF